MQWEYTYLSDLAIESSSSWLSELDFLGSKGWELVAVVTSNTNEVTAYFKRPISPAENYEHQRQKANT